MSNTIETIQKHLLKEYNLEIPLPEISSMFMIINELRRIEKCLKPLKGDYNKYIEKYESLQRKAESISTSLVDKPFKRPSELKAELYKLFDLLKLREEDIVCITYSMGLDIQRKPNKNDINRTNLDTEDIWEIYSDIKKSN